MPDQRLCCTTGPAVVCSAQRCGPSRPPGGIVQPGDRQESNPQIRHRAGRRYH